MDKFDPIWTSLIHFGQVWSILNKINPIWTTLFQFGQVWSILDKFSPIWTSLIQFWQDWSNFKKIDPIWHDMIWHYKYWPKRHSLYTVNCFYGKRLTTKTKAISRWMEMLELLLLKIGPESNNKRFRSLKWLYVLKYCLWAILTPVMGF